MIPFIYPPETTDFSSNGIGALSDAVSCFVDNEINGSYELELRYPLDGKRFDALVDRAIILAHPSHYDQAQPFRVYRISSPISGAVTVYARHIAYDLIGIPVLPFTAPNASAAMQALAANAAVSCPFTFSTDKTVSTALTLSTPRSIWEQLGGASGSMLDVYGGEYEFDRFAVRLKTRLGENRGVSIRYGKNLTSYEQDRNCGNVYTGVCPFWANADGALVQLPEKILAASGTYDHVRILTLDLSGEFEEAPTVEQLRARAARYMTDNSIGVPDISMTVGFVQLSQTEEYKDKAILEEIRLGDTVEVIFPKLSVQASSRAVKYRYNVLLDRYESITLGKIKSKISDTIADNTAASAENAEKILLESQKRQSADGKLQAELALQDDRITAKVSRTEGDYASFGWNMIGPNPSNADPEKRAGYLEVATHNKRILYVREKGLTIDGTVYARDGQIGGLTIGADSLSLNGMTWETENPPADGCYIGPKGLRYGENFKVDSKGNLHAATGTFDGQTLAGNIAYGDYAGYFSGSGLVTRSVSGGKIGASTITTTNTNNGINVSLSNADDAYDVTSGNKRADIMLVDALYTSILTASTFVFKGASVKWQSISVGGTSYTFLVMENNNG